MAAPPSSSYYRLSGSQLTQGSSSTLAGTLTVIDDQGQATGRKRAMGTSHEIVIGRDGSKCHWSFDDPYMSQKHLRIYTVVFEGGELDLEALVYAEDLSRYGTHWNGSLMGSKNDAFLLSDGDRLRLTTKTSFIFKSSSSIEHTHFDLVQEREMRTFRDKYVVTDRLLGSGAFGRVFMAVEQGTRTQVACKIVDLRRLGTGQSLQTDGNAEIAVQPSSSSQTKSIRIWAQKQKRQVSVRKRFNAYMREFDILASLSHPNIVGLDKVFVTDNSLYIFQDLITAGDLFSYIESKNHNLLEIEAAVIVRQVVIAVEYLHDQNIAHRDIKPENIMLTSPTTGARVVLTDFGSARHILPAQRATTLAGTEEYGAPEVLAQRSKFFPEKRSRPGYALPADMWSLGTVAALLLCGFRAFDCTGGFHDSEAAQRVDLSRIEGASKWRSLSERPKNFVRRLLELREQERLTAKEALEHPWFANPYHNADFEQLYERTIKSWRPRLPRTPTVDFVKDQCHVVRYLESSQKLFQEQRPPTSRRASQTPAEPPYKPFYRKLYDQHGLWPGRNKRSFGMTDEQYDAIEEWDRTMSQTADPKLDSNALARRIKLKFPRPRSRAGYTNKADASQLGFSASEHTGYSSPLQTNYGSPAQKPLIPSSNGTANNATVPTIQLPIRPTHTRVQSFSAGSTVTTPVFSRAVTSGFATINQNRTTSAIRKAASSGPKALPTWSPNVQSRSKLKAVSLSATRTKMKPLPRGGASMFDMVVDDAEKDIPRPAMPKETRDSVLQETLDDMMVRPHSAHLRMSYDL